MHAIVRGFSSPLSVVVVVVVVYFDICYKPCFALLGGSHHHICACLSCIQVSQVCDTSLRHDAYITHTHTHIYIHICMYPLNLQLLPPREHTSPSTVGPFSSTLRAVPSSSMPYSYESHCGNAGNTHTDVHAHMWVRTRRTV